MSVYTLTVQVHTGTYRYIQVYTGTYRYIQVHTGTYMHIQVHTGTYRYIQVHTGTYMHIQVHTGTYMHIQVHILIQYIFRQLKTIWAYFKYEIRELVSDRKVCMSYSPYSKTNYVMTDTVEDFVLKHIQFQVCVILYVLMIPDFSPK